MPRFSNATDGVVMPQILYRIDGLIWGGFFRSWGKGFMPRFSNGIDCLVMPRILKGNEVF